MTNRKLIKCQICGKKAVHRHHPNYDEPKKVMFVCWECHGKLHAGEESNLHQNEARLENKKLEIQGGN